MRQGSGALDAADAVGLGVLIEGAGDGVFLLGAVAPHHVADHDGRGDDAAETWCLSANSLSQYRGIGVHHRLGEAAQVLLVNVAPRFDHVAFDTDHRADFRCEGRFGVVLGLLGHGRLLLTLRRGREA